MIIVFWQRYSSDPISQRSFTSVEAADSFYRNKSIDYRDTVGRVWMKGYVEK